MGLLEKETFLEVGGIWKFLLMVTHQLQEGKYSTFCFLFEETSYLGVES